VASESPHSDDSICVNSIFIVSEPSTISDAFSLGSELECLAICWKIIVSVLSLTNNNFSIGDSTLAEALETIVNHDTICSGLTPLDSINCSVHLTGFGIVILVETSCDSICIRVTINGSSRPEVACSLPNWDGWFVRNNWRVGTDYTLCSTTFGVLWGDRGCT